MRVFLRLFSLALISALLSQTALAEDAAPATPAPAAAAPAASCKIVASVYGKDICESDIAMDSAEKANMQAYAKKNKQDPAKTELNIEKANLFATVWEVSLFKKFGAANLSASESEKEAYLTVFHNAMKEQYGFDKDLAALVKTQLQKYKYPQDIHQKLNRLGEQKAKAAAMYEKRKDMPADMKAKIDAGEAKVAEAMVKGWKVKKTLYQTYGGRVVFTQTEMEPVDAYKKFLAEIKKDNPDMIKDKRFNDVFKTMESFLDKNKTYVPDGAPELAAYFKAPGWIYSAGIGKQIFERIKASIIALPHDGDAAKADTAKSDAKKDTSAAAGVNTTIAKTPATTQAPTPVPPAAPAPATSETPDKPINFTLSPTTTP